MAVRVRDTRSGYISQHRGIHTGVIWNAGHPHQSNIIYTQRLGDGVLKSQNRESAGSATGFSQGSVTGSGFNKGPIRFIN